MNDKAVELLGNYLVALNTNPVRTKAYTSGTLNALQEIIASVVAGQKDPQTGTYVGPRVPKMALYGFFVSGPLNHYLVSLLQRAFKGRTSAAAKIGQILAANLLLSPITNTVYLVAMAIIAGKTTVDEILAVVRQTWLPVMKSTWITSPIILAVSQKFIPPTLWTPFFSLVAFVVGTYQNIRVKKRQALADAQAKMDKKDL